MSELFKKAIVVAVPFCGSLPTQIFMKKEISGWYKTIKKPCFTPPNYVFGPVWTALYASMGYSSYILWKEGGGFNESTMLPLALYGSQLVLNWMWSYVFFKYHQIGWASVNLNILYVNVIACVFTFRSISEKASNLLLPYLAWITLAGALNFRIWMLNKNISSASE